MVDVPLTLEWRIRDHRDGEVATYRGFGLKLVAQDCDGDRSWWELRDARDGDKLLALGDNCEWTPVYHFEQCLLDAEAALYAEVKRREEIAFGPKAANNNG